MQNLCKELSRHKRLQTLSTLHSDIIQASLFACFFSRYYVWYAIYIIMKQWGRIHSTNELETWSSLRKEEDVNNVEWISNSATYWTKFLGGGFLFFFFCACVCNSKCLSILNSNANISNVPTYFQLTAHMLFIFNVRILIWRPYSVA